MTEEQAVAIIARTDAAVGLLMSLLVGKGIITELEMETALRRAADAVSAAADGDIVATVFESMLTLLGDQPRPHLN